MPSTGTTSTADPSTGRSPAAFGAPHGPAPGSSAAVRLFCLPYAGGSAAVYRSWGAALGPRFPVTAVEYPGRGRRIREPVATSASALVDLLVAELAEDMRATPFAIFGHSLGGRLAFQLAHELGRRGLPRPRRLFVSAAAAPFHLGWGALHSLPEPELLAALERLGGAPAEALANREFVEFMLPVVRADLRLAETWSFLPEEPLDIPVSLLGGISDPLVPPHEMERWRGFFAGEILRRSYPGGHFYLRTEEESLLRDVSAALSDALRSTE
ncbi:alpha/beta fold hydrolase [Microbispora sp. NPDC046933]|uniref:thioesterase II family protein n=1 Tax=Microbispora sp. NPDC046933 TaxID=3155618 RepID=UPI0033EA0CEC